MATSLISTGITYSATNLPGQAAGTGEAHVLDDYEEGYWTPTSEQGTLSDSGLTEYTKIGRQVTLWTQVTFGATSNGTVQRILGLPWTSAALNSGFGFVGYATFTNAALRPIIWPSEVKINFYKHSHTSGLDAAAFANVRVDMAAVYNA